MSRRYKTKGNLQKVWNKLDKVYDNLERAFEMLNDMGELPYKLEKEIDRFDITQISSLMESVEIMMEDLYDK